MFKHTIMSKLTNISPFFIVSDVKVSATYYVNKLNFKIIHLSPEADSFFAIVGRDDISIMLKAITVDIKPVPNHTRHQWARWDAFISVTDPDALFEEFTSSGVTFSQPIQNDDDGLRGFEITDADGYVLFFGRPNTY